MNIQKLIKILLFFRGISLLLLIGSIPLKSIGQAPTLGSYPSTTITAGGNIEIVPSAAPSNTQSVETYTDSSFKGTLMVDPVTGEVIVVNAQPAGIYEVTLLGHSNGNTNSTTFTLT